MLPGLKLQIIEFGLVDVAGVTSRRPVFIDRFFKIGECFFLLFDIVV